MNAAEVHHLNPSSLTKDQLETLAFGLIGYLERYTTNGIEKPLTREEAAKHLSMGVDYIDKLKRNNVIRPHYFPESNVPFYYASEMNEALRGRKKKKS